MPVSTSAAIAVGGIAGATLRWFVADRLPVEMMQWPWATLLVNVVGCLLIGWFGTALLSHHGQPSPIESDRRPIWLTGIVTGFCGGLTTFSGLAVEVVQRLESGAANQALSYLAVTIVGSLVAVVVGRTAYNNRPSSPARSTVNGST